MSPTVYFSLRKDVSTPRQEKCTWQAGIRSSVACTRFFGELACGTRQITFCTAEKAGALEATDYSANIVEEAEKRNAGESRREKISFCVQNATWLTYEDEKFDVVVIVDALHIMPESDKALKEIRRVLKPNGILFAPTFVYEKGYLKLFMCLMERVGFKTYHK